MRKLPAAAILLFTLARCAGKPDTPAPYKPSFDSFEISYHAWVEKSFSLRIDSNKAFVCNYGHSDMNVTFGTLPDTLLQYFDRTFSQLKSDTTGMKQIADCDDCNCIAILIKKDRDSVMGVSCEGQNAPGNLYTLKTRIDSFMSNKSREFLRGYVFFQSTASMIIPPPPPMPPQPKIEMVK